MKTLLPQICATFIGILSLAGSSLAKDVWGFRYDPLDYPSLSGFETRSDSLEVKDSLIPRVTLVRRKMVMANATDMVSIEICVAQSTLTDSDQSDLEKLLLGNYSNALAPLYPDSIESADRSIGMSNRSIVVHRNVGFCIDVDGRTHREVGDDGSVSLVTERHVIEGQPIAKAMLARLKAVNASEEIKPINFSASDLSVSTKNLRLGFGDDDPQNCKIDGSFLTRKGGKLIVESEDLGVSLSDSGEQWIVYNGERYEGDAEVTLTGISDSLLISHSALKIHCEVNVRPVDVRTLLTSEENHKVMTSLMEGISPNELAKKFTGAKHFEEEFRKEALKVLAERGK